MRRCCIDIQEERLKTERIHRLGCTASDDKVLLGRQSLLDGLVDVPTWLSILTWLPDTSIDEVIPTENLFSPEFERIEQI
jgi:hypothetical protein